MYITCIYKYISIIPLLVHQPAYPSIWPADLLLQQGLSTNPGVTIIFYMFLSYGIVGNKCENMRVRASFYLQIYCLNKKEYK